MVRDGRRIALAASPERWDSGGGVRGEGWWGVVRGGEVLGKGHMRHLHVGVVAFAEQA
jgi:hypothetical protein